MFTFTLYTIAISSVIVCIDAVGKSNWGVACIKDVYK